MKTKNEVTHTPSHTPTPWHHWSDPTDGSSYHHVGPVGSKPYLFDINRHDAAFIVRAVNAHQPMLAALKAIRDYTDVMPMGVDRAEIKAFVNNAIAKAEGK